MSQMTPQEIVNELNKHIIGQNAAKRAVAIALRNRCNSQSLAQAASKRSFAARNHSKEYFNDWPNRCW